MNEKLKKIIYSDTEKDFLKNVAGELDDLVKLKGIAEMADGYAILLGLKTLDKTVLDKKLGKDWFTIYVLPVLKAFREDLESGK